MTDDSPPTTALTAAISRYTARNPTSRSAHTTALTHLPGGNTRSSLYTAPFPLTFLSGAGKTLTSADNNDIYLDFLGEYSAGIFGHSNPLIESAVRDAMARGWNLGGVSGYEAALAARVCDRFAAAGVEMVRFTNSGTEANTMALAAALAFVQGQAKQKTKKKKKKKNVLVFSNGYHGATLSFPMKTVVAAQRAQQMESESVVEKEIPTTNLPHDFIYAPYNNIPETRAIVDACLPADSSSSLAAIVFEPVQGAGGCRRASPAFVKYLRALADGHSALLIADEVMTSRLAPGGMCAEYYGIRPDMVTLGKWIGGGMSFGAFGGRRDVMGQFDSTRGGKLSHAGTFNNNVLSMAAGVVGLEICSPERIRELSVLGDGLRKRIQRALLGHGLMTDADIDAIEVDTFDEEAQAAEGKGPTRMFACGMGSLINVRFRGQHAEEWQALFFHHMLEENIYIAARGYMALTIELTKSDTDRFVDAVEKFVTRYASALKPEAEQMT